MSNIPKNLREYRNFRIEHMIRLGKKYDEIKKELGVGSSTIARVKKRLDQEAVENYKASLKSGENIND